MSGAHTGVGLDSFIGRAAPRGARGREEGSGTRANAEGVKDGSGEGEKGTGKTHTYTHAHTHTRTHGGGRGNHAWRNSGPMGKMRHTASR